MPDYIEPPLVTEADDLSDIAFEYLEDRIPGWLPSPGNLEVWLIESLAELASELTDVASTVPTSIFRYFGESLFNLPPLEAASASALSTWTARDDEGYTIPLGTLVGIPAAGDELLAFETLTETVIPPGETQATGVLVSALIPTADANGLTSTPELIDSLDFITAVELEDATSGGVDAESDIDYLDRMRGLLQLMSPEPILPGDFAVLAKTVAGVGRATAIDLYDADAEEEGIERCVTVAVADADGQELAPAIKAEVLALLEGLREVNFLVFVVDPTYNSIDVDFTFVAYPDFDGPTVAAAAVEAVELYLSPATFGTLPYGREQGWLSETHVRYLEVAEVINRVAGVNYIVDLSVEGGTTDVALTGLAPLTTPGSVTGAPA